MRIYLEAVEKVESGVEGDFIRLDITGKNFNDALKDLKSILNPSKHYIIQKHYCRHEENAPCTAEIIEEV